MTLVTLNAYETAELDCSINFQFKGDMSQVCLTPEGALQVFPKDNQEKIIVSTEGCEIVEILDEGGCFRFDGQFLVKKILGGQFDAYLTVKVRLPDGKLMVKQLIINR